MRSRNIKPGFFKNEILGQADPLLGILFAGLWCIADKEGRLEDRPLRIKAEVFPYRDGLDINRYLTDLSRLGFILRYQVDGKPLIQVLKFKDHQNPHHTEKASELVEYTIGCLVTVDSRLDNGGNPADSLIPDSLIPDLLIPKRPPLPPQGEQLPSALDVVFPAKKKKEKKIKTTGLKPESEKAWSAILEAFPKSHRVWDEVTKDWKDEPISKGAILPAQENFQAIVDAKAATPKELYAAFYAYTTEEPNISRGFVQNLSTFYGPKKATWLQWIDRGRELIQEQEAEREQSVG